MSDLWIGLDVGTTAVKAGAYTSDGMCQHVAHAASIVTQRIDGSSEQDMGAVWATVVQVLADLAQHIDASQVVSIGVAAQGDGFWAVDANGKPAGPAMLWNDTRAAAYVEQLEGTGATAAVGRACHTALWSGTSGVLWRWLRTANADAASKVARVMTCADWIAYKLSGEWAVDWANASIPFLDFKARTYGAAPFAALECDELENKLAVPRRAGERLGTLTAEASELTGLAEGTPISVGTLDLGAMIVGMGMDHAGQTMMIMGTTAVISILTDQLKPTDYPIGAAVMHPTADVAIKVFAPTSGASALDWFAGLHPRTFGGDSAGEIASKLSALVAGVPPGANGVTFLPYLSGERAPFVASDLRAAFHGLGTTTSTAEMGRAVMEGAAFSLRHCFMLQGGLPQVPVQLTGGGAKNQVWCQIIADILGQEVLVSDASDQGLWGAACIGASAAGRGDPVRLAKRTENLRTFHPDPKNIAAYDRAYARYVVLSDAARETRALLKRLQESQT
jgi:erythritol kinase (D-erythritol 1-phosphate-forming)